MKPAPFRCLDIMGQNKIRLYKSSYHGSGKSLVSRARRVQSRTEIPLNIFCSVPQSIHAAWSERGNTPLAKMPPRAMQNECHWGKYRVINNMEGPILLLPLAEIPVLFSVVRAVLWSPQAQRRLFRALLYRFRWKWPSGTCSRILQHDR